MNLFRLQINCPVGENNRCLNSIFRVMKKIVILFLILGYGLVSRAACPERIQAFYTAYMGNLLDGDCLKNKELCESCMTRALIRKIQRISSATGVDAVIRSQDINEDAIRSLSVRSLGDDWYMVRYLWDKDDAKTATEIPLKVLSTGDAWQIVYITPIWNGVRYGDHLLLTEEDRPQTISQESGQAFLESFYQAYLAPYVRMSENLPDELHALRAKYLTSQAIREFQRAEQDQSGDGVEGYDFLIDNFDFDGLWYDSLYIQSLDNGYIVEYKSGNLVHKIIIALKKCGGNYFIDGISLG